MKPFAFKAGPARVSPDACHQRLAQCICELPHEHTEAHECPCGGAWDQAGNPVRWPMGMSEDEAKAKANQLWEGIWP